MRNHYSERGLPAPRTLICHWGMRGAGSPRSDKRDFLADAKTAYPRALTGVYFCQCLSAERGAAGKYADSLYLDRRGRALTYHKRYPMLIPTLDNSYGRALLAFPAVALDKIAADVFYWDVRFPLFPRFLPALLRWGESAGKGEGRSKCRHRLTHQTGSPAR